MDTELFRLGGRRGLWGSKRSGTVGISGSSNRRRGSKYDDGQIDMRRGDESSVAVVARGGM